MAQPLKFPILKDKHLVLVGGGHAHVEVLRRWPSLPNVRVTLISPDVNAYYSGMLPGLLSGKYTNIGIDLDHLCKKANAVFYQTSVTACDPKKRKLSLKGLPDLSYDVVSFDIGSTSKKITEPSTRIIATRPLSQILKNIEIWDKEIHSSQNLSEEKIICVGAGATGFEIALALRNRYKNQYIEKKLKLILWERTSTLYPLQRRALEKRGIEVHNITLENVSVREDGLELQTNQGVVSATRMVWAGGAASHVLFQNSLLDREGKGWIRVKDSLQASDFPNIFAVGDCAELENYPTTHKAGVYPVRQAPILFYNLLETIKESGLRMKNYRPQKSYLRLLNLGDEKAIVEYKFFKSMGSMYWNLKDWIDRRFMEKYTFEPLDPMKDPNCGGCGCKVSASVLDKSLDILKLSNSKGVRLGVEEGDDIAVVTMGAETIGLTVDQFKNFGANPYHFGRIAAVNACSDLYAKGVKPQYALANIMLQKQKEEMAVNEMRFILAGAQSVMEPEGIELVGGHTIEGEESQVGFFLLGKQEESQAWGNGTLQPGDKIILTKPLGTGIILAAAMRFAVSGIDFAQLIEQMGQSQVFAMEILKKYKIGGSTDVSGFGFLRHLKNMLIASRMGASLDMSQIPVLEIASDLRNRGYYSRMERKNFPALPGAPSILHDPQTSGGILLGIATKDAQRCCEELKQVYPYSAIVGEVCSVPEEGWGTVKI